jgi:N-methylhydantoinase A
MTLRLGVDVGGTFTDLLLHDSDSGEVWLAKTPSTPADQSVGVLEGIRLVTERAGVPIGDLDAILHGTTVATNAVLERRGARVGLLVTSGFRHILHLAEAWTPGPLFGFMVYDKPEPIAALEDVREIPGRIKADGSIREELDEDAARAAIADLQASGVEALTIALFNSYANEAHEQRVAEIAAEVAPELRVSVSSTVLPEFREYERTTTTVVNAYVAPVMDRYLSNLRTRLDEAQAGAGVQVVRSDGGLMSLDAAREMPVNTVLSGPAGGVSGASYIGERAGYSKILTFDMGGTSTDVAVCLDGAPLITRETSVGDFPVRAPSVEVESIGAGGGSIAYVAEATRALRVGPESAGADPGPACYGRGGKRATVTDANVVLGHLPPRLLDGAMELDVDAAYAVVGEVAEALGVPVQVAARGIIDLVNEAMLGALRVVTVQKGRTPADFALTSFGGAGGLHANALAALLGSYPVIVPNESGVLSALGFVASDVKNEFSQTVIRLIAEGEGLELDEHFASLGGQAKAWLDGEDVPAADQSVEFSIDMRYYRQGFEIPVAVSADELGSLDASELSRRFAEAHNQLYGFDLEGGVELVCVRALANGRVPSPELAPGELGPADPSTAQNGTQKVWVGDEQVDVPTYTRAKLRPGMTLTGYAIVEQYDSTTVILPDHVATVDPLLNLIITPEVR